MRSLARTPSASKTGFIAGSSVQEQSMADEDSLGSDTTLGAVGLGQGEQCTLRVLTG